MKRWLGFAVIACVVVAQYTLWFGRGGVVALIRREHHIHTLQTRTAKLLKKDEALAAEVKSLQSGTAALEAQARSGLGMIRKGETFYEVISGSPPPVHTASWIARYQELAARG
ncbi:MAG: septum formation initiator family protein [Gammaproteobacteria bacterium]|nr:septum formation initiator family protein [Gammaproteobacteria bacterium]